VPRVPVHTIVRENEGFFASSLSLPDEPLAVLPDELYLRELFELNVSDPDQLYDFIATYGHVFHPSQGWGDLREWDPSAEVWAPKVLTEIQSRVQAELTRRIAHGELPGLASWTFREVYHLDECRVRFVRMRNMARTAIYLGKKMSVDELASSWEPGIDDAPATEPAARMFLAKALSAALSSLHPRLFATKEQAASHEVYLYAALATQLYNDIVDSVEYRKCPVCDTYFVRHRGRSGGEQHQVHGGSGIVRYCKRQCTDKAMSRDYRARNRARQLASEGLTREQIARAIKRTVDEVSNWLEG
jgi:hypothetical protein